MPQLDAKAVKDLTVARAKLALLAVDTPQLEANAVSPAKADLTATWDFSPSGTVRVATPVADSDAATKAYVDAVKTGLDLKDSCRLATDAALPAFTQAGTGVGATLTANANGILTVDGIASLLGDRILVKDEAASDADHGIYKVTTEGTASVPFVLTRAEDADQDSGTGPPNEVNAGMFTFIEEGVVNVNSGWVLSTPDPITLDTTPITFVQFSGAGSILAGAGLAKSGNTIFVGDVNKGIQANADDLQLDASEVSGDSLGQRAGGGNEHIIDWSPGGSGGLEVAGGTGSGGDAQIKVDTVTAEASVAIGANGLRAAVPSKSDKSRAAQPTGPGDFDAAFAAGGITTTPSGDGMVEVRVNGQEVEVGDSDKTKECFFSGDGGSTARAISAIVAGDTLHWVGSVALYQLSGSDVISLLYNVL